MAEFITAQRETHGVPHMTSCRALGVSRSWFYKWRAGDMSLRRARRVELDAAIRRMFLQHKRKHGSPRIVDDLRKEGWKVGVNTVAASMRAQHLMARPPKRRKNLTQPDKNARKAPDRVNRDWSLRPAPDLVWVGDLTEIPCRQGPFYLATTIDLHSRKVPGYAMGSHHDTELAKAALCMGAAVRGGNVQGLIMHTDQGGEYTGGVFAQACKNLGVKQSMGRTGSALDNAVAESFNSTLEFECIRIETPDGERFDTHDQARAAVSGFIGEYNTTRQHSSLGGLSPDVYEQQQRQNNGAGQ